MARSGKSESRSSGESSSAGKKKEELLREIEELRARLEEAEATVQAIQTGGVDALIISGPDGEKVFVLEGADYPYRVIVEVMNEGVVTLGTDGAILSCNTRFADFVKMPAEQILGKPLAGFVTKADVPKLRAFLEESAEKSSVMTVTLALADGTTMPVNLSAGAFEVGGLPALCVVLTNLTEILAAIQVMTEEKQAKLRIQQLNDMLQERVAVVNALNAELESFSHSVSHDLRTPLRFVNRIAHLLLHEPGAHLSNGATQQVSMILQATSEMAKLIENLLVFSQASRAPIRKSRVDLRRLFQEAVKELEHAQEDRSVEIVVQNLAPCQGDRALLKEVVVNLLENAFKFSLRRERARITIGCTKTEAETVYFVQDNGVGFDMSDADSLFVPFHRLHKSADFEGTGIGLALVKRIVERHGGRIWAVAEVDKGATFYFALGKEMVG